MHTLGDRRPRSSELRFYRASALTPRGPAFENIPEDFLKRLNETWSSVLGPLPDLAGSYAKTWDRIMPDKTMSAWLAVSKWVDDGRPCPGEAFQHDWCTTLSQGPFARCARE